MAILLYETSPPDTGDGYYITLKSLAGLMWNPNTSAEVATSTTRDDFDIQGTQDGTPDTGEYRFQIPNDLPIKTWRIRVYKEDVVGVRSWADDTLKETIEKFWNGLALVDPPDFYGQTSFSGDQDSFLIGVGPKVDGALVGYTVRISHPTNGEESGLAWSTHEVIDHIYDSDVHTIVLDSDCLFTLEGGETVEFYRPVSIGAHGTGTGINVNVVAISGSEEAADNAEEFFTTGGGIEDGGSGAVLSARISYSSITPDNYLEIIQGEEKEITFIVEANGLFDQESADEIRIGLKDADDTVVIKEDEDIERVCEALDVQVIRTVLSVEETYSLVEGLLRIEIAFDAQKARLTRALKIVEGIIGTGT